MTPETPARPDDELLHRLRRIFDGEYVVERKLADGGMAQLFIGTDPALRRQLVIKVLPPELTSEMSIARFRREFELTANLQHPHILPIIAAGERDGLLYYVMPYVVGESLRTRLDRDGALAVPDAVRILEEVADALAVAHRNGVVHRDIKPDNILLQEGHALLADFGIAGALGSALGGAPSGSAQRITRTGMSVGTMGYMAPEQALGESGVDGRADIYSLGVVGHEMLAGERPFAGATMHELMVAHLTKEPPRLSEQRPDVPSAVSDAIWCALRKTPEERFQTAEELRDALRWSMTSTGMTAVPRSAMYAVPNDATRTPTRGATLGAGPSGDVPPRRTRARVVVAAAAVAVVAIGGALAAWLGTGDAPPGEIVSIAVAPFNVLDGGTADGELQLWREGMVDILARNLDGAGPLRTVAPARTIRGWTGSATRESAGALARRTEARYALFGTLTPSGEEGVRLRASLVGQRDSVVWDDSWIGATVEQLSDSLTVAVLAELGRRHQLGAARRGAVGAASPLALKAFLQGEQHYRRTAWDSAGAAYARAVRADSGFAPALRRLSLVLRAQHTREDSTAREYALLAGQRNRGRGLAPRDSLLILADSLEAALLGAVRERSHWDIVRRLFATLQAAATRYPDDPEVWFTLGEARFHHGYGSVAAVRELDALAAFDRTIALDSLFAPAYIHAVDLGFTTRGRDVGLHHAARYLAIEPDGKDAAGIRVVARVTDPRLRELPETRMLLDTVGTDALARGWLALRRWPDSAETGMRLLEAMERRPRTSPTFARDSALLRAYLPLELAYRGRLRESYAALGVRPSRLFAELALLGAVPRDSARLAFAAWTESDVPREWGAAQWALPWWAAQRDTAAIRRYGARARAAVARGPSDGALGTYRVTAADAYLALARGDSADAVRRLRGLADTTCLECYADRVTLARLLAVRGQPADLRAADSLFAERLFTTLTPMEVWRAAMRAPVLRRLGEAEAAAEADALVVAAWRRGDPELQPHVRAARAALAALAARPPSAAGVSASAR